MERPDIKKAELMALQKAFKERPELFTPFSYTEDAAFLRRFGIIIPGKEACPTGYIKLYPSDFIVEEISSDGQICTVFRPAHPESIPTKDPGNDNHRALFATLVKCNISTTEAVEDMAKKLDCPTASIRYAGLKDKNAFTAQTISFHGVPTEKIAALSSPYYFLKDYRFGKGSVEKGGLKGNRFTLFIRTPAPVDPGTFAKQERKIADDGFYNFYYLQRFGVPRLINYEWGFDILRGRYKETVLGFLTAISPRELPYFQEMRRKIATMIPDWEAIYGLIDPYPLIMSNEHKIIGHLRLKPDDYVGALQAVPDQSMLWVYGFVSLLFNEMLSSYIQNGSPVPEKMPLLLSNMNEDTDFYGQLLKSIKYYPPQFANLKPFRNIQVQRRMMQCKEKIAIEKSSFTPAGVALCFSLNKGEYATTFLSHLFNIISGHPPQDISNDLIDSAALLGNESISGSLDYFKGMNTSKKDFSFEEFKQV